MKETDDSVQQTQNHFDPENLIFFLSLFSALCVFVVPFVVVVVQPLGNQELWKFVHSVYGTELGFSSNDEAPSSSSIVAVGDVCVSASAGETSPLSDTVQPLQQQQQQQHSSPSPSLHSAQTSNDDDSGVHHPVNNRHHRHLHSHHHFNQLNSRRLQVGKILFSLHVSVHP